MTDRTNTNSSDNEISDDELEQVAGGACMTFVDSAGCSNTDTGGSGGTTSGTGGTSGGTSTPTGGGTTGGRTH
jgi:hypothetical protein